MEMAILGVILIIIFLVSSVVRNRLAAARRKSFIEKFQWPPGLLAKVGRTHPRLKPADLDRIGKGLKQFFHAYLDGNYRPVSMPSQLADDLWHEFILYTRDYKAFCDNAFGRFLHHTPALVLRQGKNSENEGLRRVWWHACKLEGIDPKAAGRLPLLFALDAKFNVPNGFHYAADCSGVRRRDKTRGAEAGTSAGASGAGYCGTDFSSTSYDGTTDGMGDSSDSGSGSGDGGSDGGGDGGGCGGGGGGD